MIRLLLRHRSAVAVLVVLTTAAMAWSASSLRVDSGAESMLPTDGADLAQLRRCNALFGPDEIIVLALHSDRLFSADILDRIDRLTRRVAELPHVSRVLSPTNARDVDGDELGPFAVVPYRRVLDGEMTPQELGRMLAAHPLFGGILVSRDARTSALLIEVERLEHDSSYRSRLVDSVRELARENADGLTVHVAGIPVEKVDVARYIRRDQRLLVPLIFAVMAACMALLYRHLVGVLVPITVMAVVLVWTLGLYSLSGHSLNPVTSLLGPVILVVSLAGAVHFLNHYLVALGREAGTQQALTRAFELACVPCFNAAFTTAVGFASLALMPIPALRSFGSFAALGVMLAFPLTMVLVPLLLSWLPSFPARVRVSFRPGALERALCGFVNFVARRPLWIAAACVAVLLVSLLGIARLRVETDLIHALRGTSPLYQATRFIDRNLTGVNSIEILVEVPDVGDPRELQRVARFSQAVSELPGMRKVTGVPELYARMNRAFHEGDDAFQRLPDGPGAEDDLADIRALLEQEAPGELGRFLSPDGTTLRLAGRVIALGTAASQELFRRIGKAARAGGLPAPVLTGNFVVLSNMSTTLVRNQVRGLLPALGLILIAMILQFRSLRLGLLGVVPTAAPVLMVYGLMGWSGIALSVPTAMIAGVAIGMTVDNTIHLVAGYRRSYDENGDERRALASMVESTGRAVVYATFTAAAGFCVGIFGSFLPTVHFAVLVGAALVLGLLSVLVLLPLSLTLFRPLRGKPAVPGVVGVALLVFGCAVLAAEEAPAKPGIQLEDQYGETYGPARFAGEVGLLFHGVPTDLRKMRSWEVKILDLVDRPIGVLRAVDARDLEGKKTKQQVHDRLRRNVPREISILVDWHGSLARAYELPEGLSVTVFGPEGRVCGTLAGLPTEAGLKEIQALLAGAAEPGACR